MNEFWKAFETCYPHGDSRGYTLRTSKGLALRLGWFGFGMLRPGNQDYGHEMKPLELHAAILELIRKNPRKYRFSGICAEYPQEEKEIIEDRLWIAMITKEIALCPNSTFVALKTETT